MDAETRQTQAVLPAVAMPDPYRIQWLLVAVVLAVGAVGLFSLSTGVVFLITEILIWTLYASSLNLLMSYGGMVSFGHAAYFGLGAYGVALTIVRLHLPLGAALVAGPVLSTLGALVFGALCVRLSKVYFSMLTLACSEIVFTVIFQWYDVTGGDTGLASFVTPGLGLTPALYGFVVLAVVVAGHTLLWRVVHSPLGLAIRVVGENPERASVMGHNTRAVRLTAFVMAGFLGGIAGTLYATFHGSAFPDYAGVNFTLDGLVMIIIGGLGSFAGGVYGAVVYKILDDRISRYVVMWQLAIGVILGAVILLSPTGLAGMVERMRESWRSRGHE